MYEMKPEYLTGIDFIDQEHTKLFEIADEVYDLLTNQFITDKYDYILQVFESLRDYTDFHFKHEEEYMESIGYKKIFSQKVSHGGFIDKLNSFDTSYIDESQKETLLELVGFLNDWLINHIFKSDTLIGK